MNMLSYLLKNHYFYRMSESEMMAAVDSGPVAIYWTSTWNWMIYGGGVYDR